MTTDEVTQLAAARMLSARLQIALKAIAATPQDAAQLATAALAAEGETAEMALFDDIRALATSHLDLLTGVQAAAIDGAVVMVDVKGEGNVDVKEPAPDTSLLAQSVIDKLPPAVGVIDMTPATPLTPEVILTVDDTPPLVRTPIGGTPPETNFGDAGVQQ